MPHLVKYFGGLLLLAVLMITFFVPLPISAAPSSSHAEITLATAPDHPVACEETRLTILVKDKNRQPITNASVQVRVEMVMAGSSGMHHGGSAAITAKPSDKPGEYVATLKLGEGDWKITAASGDSSAQLTVTAAKPQAKTNASTTSQAASVAQGTRKNVSSMEAVHAAYLDLTTNISDISQRVAEWHEGNAASLKIAQEKLERVDAALQSVSWPENMARAIGETKAAVERTEKAFKEKNPAAAESAVKALGEAYHEVTHEYHADWLPGIGDSGHTSAEEKRAPSHSGSGSHGEEAESGNSGLNYYFVGSILGVVLVTIVAVAILRRRDLRTERWEAV